MFDQISAGHLYGQDWFFCLINSDLKKLIIQSSILFKCHQVQCDAGCRVTAVLDKMDDDMTAFSFSIIFHYLRSG